MIDLLSRSKKKKNTIWAYSESIVSSKDISNQYNNQWIGSGSTHMFGEDGFTITKSLGYYCKGNWYFIFVELQSWYFLKAPNIFGQKNEIIEVKKSIIILCQWKSILKTHHQFINMLSAKENCYFILFYLLMLSYLRKKSFIVNYKVIFFSPPTWWFFCQCNCTKHHFLRIHK